jgi:hypothetical protein
MCQRIESANTLQFSGQKMTISGYERSSSGTSGLKLKIDYANTVDTWGTGVQRGKVGTAFTNALASTTLLTSTSTTLTSWRYTFTVSANMAANGFQVCLGNDSTVTTTYQLSAIMLNEGMKKQKFSMFGRTFGGEVEAAQRFYETSFPLGQPPSDFSYGVRSVTCGGSTNGYTICGETTFNTKKRDRCGTGYFHTWDGSVNMDKITYANWGAAQTHNLAQTENNCWTWGTIIVHTGSQSGSAMIFNYSADAEL